MLCGIRRLPSCGIELVDVLCELLASKCPPKNTLIQSCAFHTWLVLLDKVICEPGCRTVTAAARGN